MASEGEELKPVDKMRIRVAAEGYNGYKALHDEPDHSDTLPDRKHDSNNSKDKNSTKTVCTSFDKTVTALLIVALLVIVTLSVLLALQGYIHDSSSPKTCQSPECVEISASVLTKMDLSAEPCDDFYEYACGGFEKNPLNPPDEAKYSMFSSMSRRNKALIRKLLENNETTEYMGENSTAIEKVKRYYNACMNLTATDELGVETMLKLIKDVGSWTVTSDDISGTWSAVHFNLAETVAKLHRYGTDVLFGFGINEDWKNNTINVLTFDQDGLTFSDYTHYLGNETDKYRNAYVDYFTGIAELLGGAGNNRQLANDVWQFEVKLANIMAKPEDRIDMRKLYNKMTVRELQNMIDPTGDTLNLPHYLYEMFNNKDIARTETVIVHDTGFFGNLSAVIRNTTTETLANYFTFAVVQSMMSYMPESFQGPNRKLRQVLIGVSEQRAHWLKCTSRATGTLGFAVGAMYVDQYFTEEDKQNVNGLLDQIVKEFDSSLGQVTWMDGETRNAAQQKLRVMSRKIGYPKFVKDVQKLDKHYEKLVVKDTNNFENVLLARNFGVNVELDTYGKPPDKNEWSMVPTDVNAYYSQSKNEMVFPAGILAAPFYSSAFAAAMNYGSMGFIMGHELTHGFDNKGRLMDKDGNLNSWWTEESSNKFEEKAQCLVDQYSEYKVGDRHLNGITTQSENIADNGGLKNSFTSYRKWLKAHNYKDTNSNLPGLNVTHNQLFFLAFAQTWCVSMTPEYEKAAVITDVHSNARYRVKGVLSNTADFAEAYQCKSGSEMNPKHKCIVW